MNTTHTAGEWKITTGYEVESEKGDIIAQVFDNPGEEEAEANILLIAAAPKLLAACEAVAACRRNGFIDEVAIDEAIAAIAKAKGLPCKS